MAITNLRTPLYYATEEDIENLLLIDINDSFSPQVDNWLVAAEDDVNKFLGYTTASGVLNEQITDEVSESGTIDANNDLVIYPRKRPVSSVSKIELISGSSTISLSLTSGSETRYNIPEPRNYIYYPEGEISTTSASIAISGFRDIKYRKFLTRLTYVAGYETVPGPINMATAMIASDYALRHENKNGLSMIQQGRVTKEYFQRKDADSDLRKDAMSLLRPYVRTSGWLMG